MVKGRTPELGLPSLTGRLLLGGIPCTWRRATSPRPLNLKFVAAGRLARQIDRSEPECCGEETAEDEVKSCF